MIDSPVANAYVSKRRVNIGCLCNGRVNSWYREVTIGIGTPVCTYMYCHFISGFDNFVDCYLWDNGRSGGEEKKECQSSLAKG